MPSHSFTNSNCILCRSNNLSEVLSLNKTPIADNYFKSKKKSLIQKKYVLSLIACNDCNHVQLSKIINPNLLFIDYEYQSSFSQSLLNHFKTYSSDIIKKFSLSNRDLILDIGSNDGSFLKYFKDKNINILGIDPAKKISKIANNRGLTTINSFLNIETTKYILKKYPKPKIITANNVFAHSKNLINITQCIKKLLAEDGIFIFEVSYLLNIIKFKLFDTIYHEHLSYHHLSPLSIMFNKHGLKIFDVNINSSKGGSIRCFVSHIGRKKISKNYRSMIIKESYFNKNYTKMFHIFSKFLMNSFNSINKVIDGKNVWGFGASATVTTFTFFFNIQKKLNGIFDDNPIKESCYLPSTNIKVYHSSKILTFKPDFIIILPWIYSLQIISKNKLYLNQGGSFIIPYPKLKIINKYNLYKYLN